MAWIVRGILIAAGFVVSWFVAKDTLQFSILQMVVSLLFLALVVVVLAFWPERWTHILNGRQKPR